jgi:hypothetical protein
MKGRAQIMFTLETKISIPKDVLFHEVVDETADEMVLLNLANGKYFSLDDVGTRMWVLLTEHGQLKAVHQALLEEYAVDPQQLEQDLLALTDRLVANGLLQISES